jgi:bacterial leucyl aminopeptidase
MMAAEDFSSGARMAPTPTAVFFDLGDTLGEALVSPNPVRLKDFHVFPYVAQLLRSLTQKGLRLGIISNTGSETGQAINAVLARVGLLDVFDPALLVYSADVGLTKADPRIFRLAAQRASAAPQDCVFVGEDSSERTQALAAGMRVAPHPLLVDAVIAGESLFFVRIHRTDGAALAPNFPALVALQRSGRGGGIVDAIVPSSLLAPLPAQGFLVDVLGAANLPLANDLFLIRDVAGLFGPGDQQHVLARTDAGLFVAWPASRSLSELHLDTMRHGHTLKLTPDPRCWHRQPRRAQPAAWVSPSQPSCRRSPAP